MAQRVRRYFATTREQSALETRTSHDRRAGPRSRHYLAKGVIQTRRLVRHHPHPFVEHGSISTGMHLSRFQRHSVQSSPEQEVSLRRRGNRTAVRGFAGPCLNHSATPPRLTRTGGQPTAGRAPAGSGPTAIRGLRALS